MPIFYGMLLANQLAGGVLLHVDGKIEGANVTAYAARQKSGFKVAIFNKDESQAVELSIHTPHRVQSATAWRLQAPALDSTDGVTLAGAEIGRAVGAPLPVVQRRDLRTQHDRRAVRKGIACR